MPGLKDIVIGIRSLLAKKSVEQDLDEELQHYQDALVASKIEGGMSPEEALRVARVETGSTAAVKDSVREVGWESVLESIWHDVRYALRALRKTPVLTIVVVSTLGLALGANSAVFSVVNWLVLRPLPVEKPSQLTFLAFPRGNSNFDERFSYPEFQDARPSAGKVFSDVGLFRFAGNDGLTLGRNTEPVQAVFVSGNFFSLLGIQPHLGRFFLPSEGGKRGGDPVVVLSYQYWNSRFAGDPSIIGKPALLNGVPITIVGVGPKEFHGVTPIVEMQAYLPLGMVVAEGGDAADFFTSPAARSLVIIGRLRPGVTRQGAEAALGGLSRQLVERYPRPQEGNRLLVKPLRPPGILNGPDPLPLLSALFVTLAGLVLVLAGMNVTNLLLARAETRRQEMAIRAALGATQRRLIRQALTEAVLLAVLGGVAGVLVGIIASAALRSIPLQTQDPIVLDFRVDWRVLAYVFGASLVAGLLLGVTPALRSARVRLSESLHESGNRSTPARNRMRVIVVVVQVAGSLALMIAAGLFVRSMLSAEQADLGFDPEHVLNITLAPHQVGYDEQRTKAFYAELLERAHNLPGVQSASLAMTIPFGDVFSQDLQLPGHPTPADQQPPSAYFNAVSPTYFRTMGIAISEGRQFRDSDTENSQRVAIISRAMAYRLWPNQDPLGKEFSFANDPKRPWQVVGVAGDTRFVDLGSPLPPMFYVPIAQNYAAIQTLQLRTSGPPANAAPAVLELVRSIAPAMPVQQTETMKRALHSFNGLLLFEIGAALAMVLGGLGLILALVGIYGVIFYTLSQRTQEIGIRMALGAQRRQLLATIGLQGVKIVSWGVGAGLLVSFALGKMLSEFLVGVRPVDPLTYVATTMMLATVALLAAFLPARKATLVDPVVALRRE